LAGNSHDADTTASDSVISSTTARDELVKHSDTVQETDDVANAVGHGIYMENGNTDAVPLEPMKAEKHATFGESSVSLFSDTFTGVAAAGGAVAPH